MRIRESFGKKIDKEAVAYALVLCDRFINLELGGNKMTVVCQ